MDLSSGSDRILRLSRPFHDYHQVRVQERWLYQRDLGAGCLAVFSNLPSQYDSLLFACFRRPSSSVSSERHAPLNRVSSTHLQTTNLGDNRKIVVNAITWV